MAEIKVGHPDIVSVTIGPYLVERLATAEGKGWVPCWNSVPRPDRKPGETMTHSVPAEYVDIVEAEQRLNEFRDRNPHISYRLTRPVTVVEVVHA